LARGEEGTDEDIEEGAAQFNFFDGLLRDLHQDQIDFFEMRMVKAFGANGAHKNENRLRGTTPHGNPMHLSRKVVYNIRKNVMGLPDNSPM
jgi:ketosteroid isomerase-like protein